MTDFGKARIDIVSDETLSKNWYHLRNVTYDYTGSDGRTSRQKREVYDRGNGATILLRDRARDKVVLVRQFRMPALQNGHSGWLIETPAGLLDGQSPEEAIRREAMEETGYRVGEPRFLFRSFMSPGAVTETIDFFAADVDLDDRIEAGGGVAHEHEDIEVLEVAFDEALAMVASGEICDAKTIMLLHWAQIERLQGR